MKGHPRTLSIDNKNILLRGSVLKNTKWVAGVAIYVGNDTKLMMNSSKPPKKISNIEHRVNKYIFIVFTVLGLISILSGIISWFYNQFYSLN